ncbi:MAG: DUF4233 domain-containing protein [Actinomycetia bacterium]|nr:DUF4233 domain-containing protein [Actinomycetes bacterium]
MRALGSSVLVFEWIIFVLAVPVAINVAGVTTGAALTGLLAVTALVLAGIMNLPGRVGITFGWLVQLAALLSAFVVFPMLILGAMFTGLWWLAVRLGTQADARQAEMVDLRG